MLNNLDLFEELQRAAGDSLPSLYTGAGVLSFNPINRKSHGSVFRIRDILVRIRMRIPILGSISLTNGSGCGAVPKSSVTFKMQKLYFSHFLCFNNETYKLKNCKNMFHGENEIFSKKIL
jgi:hypothetical protein